MNQQICPSGRKDDNGKNRLDLIPPEVILALGQVMTYGAGKYGANNWQGVETDRYYAALLLRRLWCFWGVNHDHCVR